MHNKIKFSLIYIIIKNEFRILLLKPYWKGTKPVNSRCIKNLLKKLQILVSLSLLAFIYFGNLFLFHRFGRKINYWRMIIS
jgi:hypothetical protein